MSTSAPLGLVCKAPEGSTVQLLAAGGAAPVKEDGSDVAAVRVTLPTGESVVCFGD